MRNQYPGPCYRCGETVAPGDGHFERFGHSWRVQHATCAIRFRGTPDPARQALNMHNLKVRAAGTGKRAQRARKRIRDLMNTPVNPKDF